MRFGKYLESHAHPPWRSRYLSYKRLKHKLKDLCAAEDRLAEKRAALDDELVIVDDIDETTSLLSWNRQDCNVPKIAELVALVEAEEDEFRQILSADLEKVNQHFKNQLAKAHATLDDLNATVDELELHSLSSSLPLRKGLGSIKTDPYTTTNTPASTPTHTPTQSQSHIDAAHVITPTDIAMGVTNGLVLNSLGTTEVRTCDSEASSSRQTISAHGSSNGQGVLDASHIINDQRFTYSLGHLKQGFHEYYLHLSNIKSYQLLNSTACMKILKKHDKHSDIKLKDSLMPMIRQMPFAKPEICDTLIGNMEGIYADIFHRGDRTIALRRLQPSKISSHKKMQVWRVFRLGLYMGIIGMSFLAGVINVIGRDTHDVIPKYEDSVWLMFRAAVQGVLLVWLFGINVFAWNRSGVNHQYVFEFHPTKYLTYLDFFEFAALLSIIVAGFMLLYLSDYVPKNDAHNIPIALFGTLFAILINPLHIMHRSTRYWLIRRMGRVIGAPFISVGFADFWLADQFTSCVTMFLDFEFGVCHYSLYYAGHQRLADNGACSSNQWPVRAFIYILPAWFRFAQCLRRYFDTGSAFPHLVNAGKYSSSIMATILMILDQTYREDQHLPTSEWTLYMKIWIFVSIVQTIYALTYDLKMDWGLLKAVDTSKFMLRDTLFYSRPVYYIAIVFDIAGRCMWTIKLVPYAASQAMHCSSAWFSFGLAIIEIMRRFVWNFFRVENEYVNDCLQFHSVLTHAGIISSEGAAPAINKETYAMLRAEHNRNQKKSSKQA